MKFSDYFFGFCTIGPVILAVALFVGTHLGYDDSIRLPRHALHPAPIAEYSPEKF